MKIEVPSFYLPQVMSPVAAAVAALDTYMFDEGGRYDFAVRAVENATLDEAEHDIRPQAYWRELSARQLRPMVLSGAARVFYVAEVEPVDNPFKSGRSALDWEDFCPAGPTECALCGGFLPPGEGTSDWAGTGMHVCEHHEYALCPPAIDERTFMRHGIGKGGQRTHYCALRSVDSAVETAAWARKRRHHLRPATAGSCALVARQLLRTILVCGHGI